jgi:shikimate dehydrogenase
LSGLYGLLGESLKHSISPEIHSLIFKELNIDGYYHLFEVEKSEIKNAVYGLKALGVKGANVTIPYKLSVMEYIDEISREAEKIGAVNTICFCNNRTIGYNTDYYGFGMMLQKYEVEVRNKNVVILGSGGVSRSVLQYLSDNEIKDITIVSRNKENLKSEFSDIEAKFISYVELQHLSYGDIIINCTPCGMYNYSQGSPVEKEIISKFLVAVDLIYNPAQTIFLKYAEELNVKYINGLYMLVGQAVAAQELWNNVKIDNDAVNKIWLEIKNMKAW